LSKFSFLIFLIRFLFLSITPSTNFADIKSGIKFDWTTEYILEFNSYLAALRTGSEKIRSPS
jgi:hypothetical protein